MNRSWLALCTFGCGLMLAAHAQKIVEPADIANLKRVSGPQISPDGLSVVYELGTPVAAGKHKIEFAVRMRISYLPFVPTTKDTKELALAA